MDQNRNTVRYGILSTASIVPRFCKGMEQTGNGSVSAISSRDLKKAEQFAANLSIPKAYDDYQSILSDPEIDAVYIPLVNSLHYPYAREALLCGKHVVMEKPFVLHGEEAEESEEGTILKVLSVQCVGVQYGHQHAEKGTYNGDEKAVEIGSPQLVS